MGLIVSVLGTAVLATSLSACGSAGGPSDSDEALPPLIVTPAELEGGSFQITEQQPLVINAEDTTEWTGQVSDGEVAEFIPGTDEDGMQTNPGFAAKKTGETEASVTSPTGEVYEFSLVVP